MSITYTDIFCGAGGSSIGLTEARARAETRRQPLGPRDRDPLEHHGGLEYGPIGHMVKDVRDPLASIVARPNLSLVIPYRRGAAKTTAEPLHTVATKESAALVSPAVDVNDCHFRMLQPREHMRAQRFPDSYRVLGNKGEQTMQAGNAVSSNVSHWIGRAAVAVLS